MTLPHELDKQRIADPAPEIESSRASSTVVGGWAASVQQWMTPAHTDADLMDDGDDAGSGDIIARAKGAPTTCLDPGCSRHLEANPFLALQPWAFLPEPSRHSTRSP